MDHVEPAPSTDTWKPNDGLAMTLIHGAGVMRSFPKVVTYSLPSAVNPPMPLANSVAGRDGTTSLRVSSVRAVANLSLTQTLALSGNGIRRWGGATSFPSRGLSCSERLPRRLRSTARAALWSSMRTSSETKSARTRKMFPCAAFPMSCGRNCDSFVRRTVSREPWRSMS